LDLNEADVRKCQKKNFPDIGEVFHWTLVTFFSPGLISKGLDLTGFQGLDTYGFLRIDSFDRVKIKEFLLSKKPIFET
jgi:hypothetical protein